MVSTKVFGYSDDLVEIEHMGDGGLHPHVYEEIFCPDSKQCRILFEDGTCISVSYGKGDLAVWKVSVNRVGTAAQTLTICNDENAPVYSDVFEIDSAIKKHLVIRKNSSLFLCPECGGFMQPEIALVTKSDLPPKELICASCSNVESTKTYRIEVEP